MMYFRLTKGVDGLYRIIGTPVSFKEAWRLRIESRSKFVEIRPEWKIERTSHVNTQSDPDSLPRYARSLSAGISAGDEAHVSV